MPWPYYLGNDSVFKVQGGSVGLRAGLEGRKKFQPLPRFNPQTVQPVASRYNDYNSPA